MAASNDDILVKLDNTITALYALAGPALGYDLNDAVLDFADRLAYVRAGVARGKPPALADRLPPRLQKAAIRAERRALAKRDKR